MDTFTFVCYVSGTLNLLGLNISWKLPGCAIATLSLLLQASLSQATLFVGVRAAFFTGWKPKKVLSCVYLFKGAHLISSSSMSREGFQGVNEDPCLLLNVCLRFFYSEERSIGFLTFLASHTFPCCSPEATLTHLLFHRGTPHRARQSLYRGCNIAVRQAQLE